jgi:hypothetical protein
MCNECQEDEMVIGCDLTAISAEDREQHITDGKDLFASVLEMRELPDGYAFRLPSESATLAQVANWITYERLCCPFFTFGIIAEPQQGAIWLRLTGTPEVKQFISMEFPALIGEGIASPSN